MGIILGWMASEAAETRGMATPPRRRPSPLERTLHDLGSPTLAAWGWVELLAESRLGERQRELVERVRACLREIRMILGAEPREEIFAPTEELEEVASGLALMAREKDMRLLCSRRGGGPWRVSGSRTAFRRIVSNLASNALRHAPGGCVELESALRRAESGWILRVEVRDEGPGVDRSLGGKLFTPGVRRPGSPGKGLGLHGVRESAKALGGEAGASATGRGAVFWAEIRVRAAAGREPEPGTWLPVVIWGGPRRQRRWLARMLAGWGVPCAEVGGDRAGRDLPAAREALGGRVLVLADGQGAPPGAVSLGDPPPCGPAGVRALLQRANLGADLRKGGPSAG